MPGYRQRQDLRRSYLISPLRILSTFLGEGWLCPQYTPKSCMCVCVCFAAGPLTIQEALTYFGGAVASTTGLVMGGTLLALLRKRCRQKGK